jgi:hypothetical protein
MIASGPVIPVFSRRLSMAADVASVQFSRTVERLYAGLRWACADAISISRLRLTPGGRRSLKTQQHAGGLDATSPPGSRVGRGLKRGAARRSGSVDMLGPVCSVAARAPRDPRVPTRSRGRLDRGTVMCSLERR